MPNSPRSRGVLTRSKEQDLYSPSDYVLNPFPLDNPFNPSDNPFLNDPRLLGISPPSDVVLFDKNMPMSSCKNRMAESNLLSTNPILTCSSDSILSDSSSYLGYIGSSRGGRSSELVSPEVRGKSKLLPVGGGSENSSRKGGSPFQTGSGTSFTGAEAVRIGTFLRQTSLESAISEDFLRTSNWPSPAPSEEAGSPISEDRCVSFSHFYLFVLLFL